MRGREVHHCPENEGTSPKQPGHTASRGADLVIIKLCDEAMLPEALFERRIRSLFVFVSVGIR